MNNNEKLFLEAIDTMLRHRDNLGLPKPEKKDEEEHSLQFLHEHINDLFAVRTADYTHHDGVCQAFAKAHGYKYITDPSFAMAMDKEMTAQGIPTEEREKALALIPKIIEEVGDSKNWAEQDAGFNPNLDEILEISRTGQAEE